MQDFAHLLDSNSYLKVSQVYFLSIKQSVTSSCTCAEPLIRTKLKLYFLHRALEILNSEICPVLLKYP